ncbi:thioredoxin family protein [Paenibacillus sp.]|uniref:thioredoxin family protein n=1 Tax=Paenibacillus sp. TaxID=58172 RepID=UPI002810EC40|nr:thioredoxin family protein [Paenibacillus sp.]
MSGPMTDVAEQELIRRRWSGEAPFAVYFYTPWCGTCRYGEKMLTVVRAMAPDAAMFKANVNFMPTVVQDWKIESVPCLAFVEEKRVTEKVYTMRSVEYLLERVRARLGT